MAMAIVLLVAVLMGAVIISLVYLAIYFIVDNEKRIIAKENAELEESKQRELWEEQISLSESIENK